MSSEQDIEQLQARAGVLADNGEWNESNGLLGQAIGFWERRHGPGNEQALECRTILAYNYRCQGRYQQARDIDSFVLNQRRDRYGTEHSSTAKSLNNLALDLKGLGITEGALDLEQQALTILIRVDGEDAPSTLTSMHNLANSYAKVQRHRDAADLHSKVVDARIRGLGEGHAETIAAMDLLGVDHRNLGDTNAAVSWQQRAVDLATSHLGSLHDTTIRCTINMATTCRAGGRVDDAVGMLEAAQRSYLAPGREETLLTISLTNSLAAAYCEVGRLDRAKPLLERCYSFNRRVLGSDHPTTIISRDSLQYVLGELGEHTWTRIG